MRARLHVLIWVSHHKIASDIDNINRHVYLNVSNVKGFNVIYRLL